MKSVLIVLVICFASALGAHLKAKEQAHKDLLSIFPTMEIMRLLGILSVDASVYLQFV